GIMLIALAGGWHLRTRVLKMAAALEQARHAEQGVEHQLYFRCLEGAVRHLADGHVHLAEECLRECPPAGAGPDQRPWEWRYLAQRCRPGRLVLRDHESTVMDLAFQADGKVLATASQDGNVRFWDPETGVKLRGFQGPAGRPGELRF